MTKVTEITVGLLMRSHFNYVINALRLAGYDITVVPGPGFLERKYLVKADEVAIAKLKQAIASTNEAMPC